MKRFTLFFLPILLGSFLNITAQHIEPVQITQGSISVFRVSPEPETIVASWSIGGDNASSISTHSPFRIGTMPTFFSNRQAANAIFVVEPSTETRGDMHYSSVGFINVPLAFADAPLSTRFEIRFDDFRVPKFPKTGPPNNAEIIVPFTVTGRVSAFGLQPTPYAILSVNGSGRARLIFSRLNNGGQRVKLTYAFFGFGTQAPQG